MSGLELLVDMLFGWFAFVLRVFPHILIRWDGIAIFGVAFLVALCCARSFLNWMMLMVDGSVREVSIKADLAAFFTQ